MNIPEYFSTRSTIRKYSDKTVSDRDIKAMLEAASHAPTTGNMQLCSVVVTRDADKLAQLRPCHFNQPAAMSAPVMLTFCADTNRFERWCACRDAKPGFDNEQMFLAAVMDAVIFAQQFVTIAEMNGLGTCYLGTTAYNAPEIADVLRLPDGVVPVLTVTLGWPDEPAVDSGRLHIDAIMHNEVYRDYTPAAIDGYYGSKESRADSRRFVAENGKQTLAQVFADVRYPADTNRTFSQKLADYLATHFYNRGDR